MKGKTYFRQDLNSTSSYRVHKRCGGTIGVKDRDENGSTTMVSGYPFAPGQSGGNYGEAPYSRVQRVGQATYIHFGPMRPGSI